MSGIIYYGKRTRSQLKGVLMNEAEEEYTRSAYERHESGKCWLKGCFFCVCEQSAKRKELERIIRKLKAAKCIDTREVLAFLGD